MRAASQKDSPERSALIQFNARIDIRGINPFVLVSARRATALKKGWRKPLPVLVRINDMPKEPWRINMMPVGDGSFYLYLHDTVRKASLTKAGDRVQVELRFDQQYRGGPAHPLPAWFSKALAAHPPAKQAWQALTPSRQKEVLRYFAQLKSEEARKRNLEKAMMALSGVQTRFMARTWVGGK